MEKIFGKKNFRKKNSQVQSQRSTGRSSGSPCLFYCDVIILTRLSAYTTHAPPEWKLFVCASTILYTLRLTRIYCLCGERFVTNYTRYNRVRPIKRTGTTFYSTIMSRNCLINIYIVIIHWYLFIFFGVSSILHLRK